MYRVDKILFEMCLMELTIYHQEENSKIALIGRVLKC